ncbi:MAG: ACT domain-containing protein [Planctomycetes bacterium]|nr:ACT domain-containing protein [Planctomycetota bacterium]MCB9887140.1 ACT domain-containing protein [Planctomycetota bacterium]
MSTPHLRALVAALEPRLLPGTFAFVSVPLATDLDALDSVATMREAEGLSLIVPLQQALDRGLPVLFRAAQITLCVASELQAVGLTAVVAAALADAGLPCNVVAGARHDHLFVPDGEAPRALQVLRELQGRWSSPID